jgi:hypothetical protein
MIRRTPPRRPLTGSSHASPIIHSLNTTCARPLDWECRYRNGCLKSSMKAKSQRSVPNATALRHNLDAAATARSADYSGSYLIHSTQKKRSKLVCFPMARFYFGTNPGSCGLTLRLEEPIHRAPSDTRCVRSRMLKPDATSETAERSLFRPRST